jgi:AraC family transcriptional regulator, positive regulator of tynA and feaB
VLRANNTSFSDLLWSQRLPSARDWLVSESFRRYPIHKVACMAGFKSAAHFSRMFKSAYGISPKEYRAQHEGVVVADAVVLQEH